MDTGMKTFLIIIALLCVILLWAMLIWPVALIGTIIVIVCVWGTVFGGFTSYACDQAPNDPYCAEQVE